MTLLILAMVLSAAGMKAYEQGKTRSKARWEEARRRAAERGAARERVRQRAARMWARRWNSAIAGGPRRALWWAYAGGYVAGGAVMALGAGAVGVYSGAVAGGRSGYRVGIEAGKAGRRYGEAFQQWRRANRGQGDPVELGICGRCGGWIRESELVADTTHGRVCPECVPSTKSEHRKPPAPDEPISVVHERKAEGSQRPRCKCGGVPYGTHEYCWACLMRAADHWDRVAERAQERRRQEQEHRKHCPGNSSLGPDEARARGLCPGCGGNRQLITDFGGEHKHVTCPECQGSGKYTRTSRTSGPFTRPRCECGRPTLGGPRCDVCAAKFRKERESAKAADAADSDKSEPIRVTAERIYPEQEEHQPKEITTMTALPAGQDYGIDTSAESIGGIKETLTALTQQGRTTVSNLVDLSDSMSGKRFAAEDLTAIAEAIDGLEAAVSQLEQANERIQEHDGVDLAASELGSERMADASVYGNA